MELRTPPRPVFIRGMSRSGGTLLVTLLDAHPDLAMSYELYPNLLDETDGSEINIEELGDIFARAKSIVKASKRIADKKTSTFFIRCSRGGLSSKDMSGLLAQHQREGLDFSVPDERLRFMERCCVAKMNAAGKSRWGVKCSSHYKDYLNVWPEAYFLNIVRDGRDVLASQMNTGAFNPKPEELGRGWARTHSCFRELAESPSIQALEIFYEALVQNPEAEMQRVCSFLDIPFTSAILEFYKQDLTIYKASHLSMERISKPVDASKVGRWKKELSEEQLSRFYSTAREAMEMLGYL